MLKKELIERTKRFLLQKYAEGEYLASHPEAKAYRIEHSYRVANIGRQIAKSEGFDETEMVIACLLHDVSYCETFGESGWQEHGRRAAHIARPFLTELGLNKARINDICYGIAIHVDDKADFEGERTAFALTVGDADNIDRFDVLRLHETLCRDKFLDLRFEEKLELASRHAQRLRELQEIKMGTATVEAIWRERLAFSRSFYAKMIAQLRSSEAILGE